MLSRMLFGSNTRPLEHEQEDASPGNPVLPVELIDHILHLLELDINSLPRSPTAVRTAKSCCLVSRHFGWHGRRMLYARPSVDAGSFWARRRGLPGLLATVQGRPELASLVKGLEYSVKWDIPTVDGQLCELTDCTQLEELSLINLPLGWGGMPDIHRLPMKELGQNLVTLHLGVQNDPGGAQSRESILSSSTVNLYSLRNLRQLSLANFTRLEGLYVHTRGLPLTHLRLTDCYTRFIEDFIDITRSTLESFHLETTRLGPPHHLPHFVDPLIKLKHLSLHLHNVFTSQGALQTWDFAITELLCRKTPSLVSLDLQLAPAVFERFTGRFPPKEIFDLLPDTVKTIKIASVGWLSSTNLLMTEVDRWRDRLLEEGELRGISASVSVGTVL